MWVGSSGGYTERPDRTKVAAAVTLPRPCPCVAEGGAEAASVQGLPSCAVTLPVSLRSVQSEHNSSPLLP